VTDRLKGAPVRTEGLLNELLTGTATPSEITIVLGQTAKDLVATRPDESPLVVILRYWESLRRNGALPRRSEIDPVRIDPLVLPSIALVDVVAGAPRRFRYRLVGTQVAQIFGADYTGCYMDEIVPPALKEQVQRAYDFGYETGDVVLFYGAYVRADSTYYTVTRVVLPVLGPDGNVDCFLSAVSRDFEWLRPLESP
jgi:hypothetical protein